MILGLILICFQSFSFLGIDTYSIENKHPLQPFARYSLRRPGESGLMLLSANRETMNKHVKYM